MAMVTRRNVITLIELVLGVGLLLLSVRISSNMFKPISGGHVDGRGIFSLFIIPPIAAFGGCLIAHIVPRYAAGDRPRVLRYGACAVFSVLAVVPSVLYIIWFGDENISKSLATYDSWFVIALLVGVVGAAVSDIRYW